MASSLPVSVTARTHRQPRTGRRHAGATFLAVVLFITAASAQVPNVLNYQGRISVSGANFTGSGQFKFAFVNGAGTTTYWSNDGTSTAGAPPAAAVTLTVTRGLYQVLLGDCALANMTAAPHNVFDNSDVRLRIWFNDGPGGFQQLTPDHRLAPAGYAMKAASVSAGGILTAPAQWVHAWGENTSGALNVPAGLTSVAQVAAGAGYSLARRDDGTVVAWGRNTEGQTTVPVAAATAVSHIAAGSAHSLAAKTDGTVAAWGLNDLGQATVPGGMANVVQVAAGEHHSMARRSDGTVAAWGDNAHGETAVPSGLSGVIAVSACGTHTLALRAPLVPASFARLDEMNVFTQKIGIGRVPATNMLEVEGPVSKTTAGNWSSNSDRRIKTDIQPVTGALAVVDKLNPVTFRYTPAYLAQHPGITDVPYYNVIAQEFRAIFPDAVKSSGEKLPDGSDILQVDTYPATITSLAAVKELHALVKTRDMEVAELKARLARMEETVARLSDPKIKRLSTAARAWRCACPCLLLDATTAEANPQFSASYAIDPDTTDFGGGHSASALYANLGSLAEITGVSTAAAPPETANHSYIGQLSDITALQLHAAPLTVPEYASLQISAAAVLDDLTTIPLAPHQVAWSVLAGPIAGISTAVLATAAVVYQDTAASVQGIHAGFTGSLDLTVRDTIADNFGLYAGDGLGDAWQVQHFGVGNANAAPLLDPDHDGWINLFEYNAGLVPTDSQSVFHFREETVPGQSNQRRILFSPRLPGSTYTVMASTTTAAGSWQPLTGAITTDNGSERTVTDTDATGPRKFYQIEVQKP